MCPDNLKSASVKSGGDLLIRPLSSGQQSYDTNKNLWPLQQPVEKLEGIAQVCLLNIINVINYLLRFLL